MLYFDIEKLGIGSQFESLKFLARTIVNLLPSTSRVAVELFNDESPGPTTLFGLGELTKVDMLTAIDGITPGLGFPVGLGLPSRVLAA